MDIEKQVQALQREIERRFPMKDCAKCKAEVTMILVETWPDSPEVDCFKGYRCQKCGTLYKEVLQEVVEK